MKIIIIIIIIIIIHSPYFTAIYLIVKIVVVWLTKNFFFISLPKSFWHFGRFKVLFLSAFEYVERGGDREVAAFRVFCLE
jgi:hypothetical protein